jgi:transcriptional antiterminator RfaH
LRRADLEVYLPQTKESGSQQRQQPFFPCYLFLKMDLEKVKPSRWQWTPGLRRVVAFGDRPTPLPDEVVHIIRRKLESRARSDGKRKSMYRKGQRLEVVDGPFREMSAIFDRDADPEGRIQVLLEVMGRLCRVELPAENVQKSTQRRKRKRRSRGRGRPIRES